MRNWKPELPRAAFLVGAVALLDVFFGVHNWAPFLEWWRAPLPTLEALVLIGLLPFVRRARRPALAVVALSLAAAVLAALSLGEGIYQHAYREPFDPLTDLKFLPALAEVVFGGTLFRRPAVAALLYAAAYASIVLPIGAILALSRRAATPRAALLAGGVSLGVALVVLAVGSPAGAGFSRPAAALALRHLAAERANSGTGVSTPAPLVPPAPFPSEAESVPHPRDLHLLVVESYAYHRRILYRDFGYAGPNMGFGVMPDQYTLAFVLHQEVQAEDRLPLFVHAILVSSHTPWHTIPVYVEDWQSIGDGSLWNAPGQRTFHDGSPIGGESSAYADSIAYVLKVVGAYAARSLGERGLAVVVGDHQPKYPVSERGATLSVVAHVLSRDIVVLDRLRGYGWVEGLEAPEPAISAPLEALYKELVSVLQPDPLRYKMNR